MVPDRAPRVVSTPPRCDPRTAEPLAIHRAGDRNPLARHRRGHLRRRLVRPARLKLFVTTGVCDRWAEFASTAPYRRGDEVARSCLQAPLATGIEVREQGGLGLRVRFRREE